MRTLLTRWQRFSFLLASRRQLATIGCDQIGSLYWKERALDNRTLVRWIPGCPLMGSSSQPRPWSNVAGPWSCGPQSGPMSLLPFSSVPSSPPTRFTPQFFRVLLLRCLWFALPLSHLPVWPSTRRPWPPPCSRAGVLGSRGFFLESAAARVCREAFDLDLPIANHDACRLEGRCESPIGHRYHVSFVGVGRQQTSPAVCSR